MGYMKTRYSLSTKYKDICVRYHKARMPCGLQSLLAVQYGNCRLKYYSGSKSADSFTTASGAPSVYPGIPKEGDTLFGTHLVKRPAVHDGEEVEFTETDLCRVMDLAFHGEHWYYTELDYINTSFADGIIRVFFKKLPVDQNGLPLIPDEENYKEALYYYGRGKMIGAGYVDKVFTEQQCMDRFEKYAERAMSKITYPSVDEVDARAERVQRMILPTDFWSTFHDPATENDY